MTRAPYYPRGPAVRPITIPGQSVCYTAGLGQYAVGAVLLGPGKLKTSDGNLRAPRYASLTSAPNPTAINATNSGDVNAAFGMSSWANYDYSHALSAEEFHISGAATLGQPAAGYVYMPGSAAHTAFFDNSSGWNQSTSSNSGRTAAVFDQLIAQQSGQGDMIGHETELLCGGQPKAGATNFLANPACSVEAGDIGALSSGQYLQQAEWHLADNGSVVAALGRTMGYTRTQPTGTKNEFWEDSRIDCNGANPAAPACDGVSTITGSWRIGIDFTSSFAHVLAPLAMQAGQKITLNGTNSDNNANPGNAVLGGDWLTYDASTGTIQLADQGTPVVKLSNAQGAVNGWAMMGSVSGSAVTLLPNGSDAAIASILGDKGGAGLVMMSNGQLATVVKAPSNASSYLLMQPGGPAAPYLVQALSAAKTDLNLSGSSGGGVHIVGTMITDTHTPASSSEACVVGQTAFDNSYEYRCVAANSWKRAALTAF